MEMTGTIGPKEMKVESYFIYCTRFQGLLL